MLCIYYSLKIWSKPPEKTLLLLRKLVAKTWLRKLQPLSCLRESETAETPQGALVPEEAWRIARGKRRWFAEYRLKEVLLSQ